MLDQGELLEELQIFESELAQTRQVLAYLTSPDYDPQKNPDDEFREKDIEDCLRDIATYERAIAKTKKLLDPNLNKK